LNLGKKRAPPPVTYDGARRYAKTNGGVMVLRRDSPSTADSPDKASRVPRSPTCTSRYTAACGGRVFPFRATQPQFCAGLPQFNASSFSGFPHSVLTRRRAIIRL
jgi:hypothetical protein